VLALPAALLRLQALIAKELLIAVRDPRARLMLLVPPLIQLVIFSFATTLEVRNVRVMVFCEDAGRHGAELARRLEGSAQFSEVRRAESEGQWQGALERGEILFAVHVPPDFSRRIERGERAELGAFYDGRRSNSAQIAHGYLQEIVEGYLSEIGPRPAAALDARGRNWFNPNLDHVWTTIPSLVAILTLLLTMSFSALSLAREKELGTYEQLIAAPFTPFEILLGKLVPAMIVGICQGLLIAYLGRFLFGVPFLGSLPLLLLALAAFSYSVVGFGLLISTFARTQQQAILGAFIVMVPSVALSGFAAPVDNMPEWLQRAVWLNPTKHGIFIFKGIFLKGLPLEEVATDMIPLLVIGTASFALSALLFRKNGS
jgi:ABC-2 type transport system permease protein